MQALSIVPVPTDVKDCAIEDLGFSVSFSDGLSLSLG
jgi:hypothetical protein